MSAPARSGPHAPPRGKWYTPPAGPARRAPPGGAGRGAPPLVGTGAGRLRAPRRPGSPGPFPFPFPAGIPPGRGAAGEASGRRPAGGPRPGCSLRFVPSASAGLETRRRLRGAATSRVRVRVRPPRWGVAPAVAGMGVPARSWAAGAATSSSSSRKTQVSASPLR